MVCGLAVMLIGLATINAKPKKLRNVVENKMTAGGEKARPRDGGTTTAGSRNSGVPTCSASLPKAD